MKKLYLLTLSLFIASISFGQRVAITGIMDGTCTGGTPKAVEIYVEGTINFAVTNFDLVIRTNNNSWDNNSGQSLSGLGVVTDNFAYIVNSAAQITQFQNEFPTIAAGLNFKIINNTEVNHNGDDSYRIVDSSKVTVDQFGGDSDGTGTAWEYTDSYALRNNATGPDSSGFVVGNWSFGGTNFLDNKGDCNSDDLFETYVSFGSLLVLPVEHSEIEGFAVYPNPVSNGYLTIRSINNAEKIIQVYDVIGKQVFAAKTRGNEAVDVSSISKGVYILKVDEEGKTATRKLIIE